MKWGDCILIRPATLAPGTRVNVNGVWGQIRNRWLPAEDFAAGTENPEVKHER